MKPPKRVATLVAVLLAAPILSLASCSSISAPAPGQGEAFRVLFIGNSLTYFNDMPGMLEAFLDSAGFDGYVASEARPNFGLEDHWHLSAALDSVRVGGWDFVAMQQGPSATEGRPSLLEWSYRFADSIRAVGAKPAMYMVWPSENRSFDFEGVAESYRMAAERIDGALFPVGDAWQLIFDGTSGIQLYGPDRFHPSTEASYLAAAVIFAIITREDPTALPATITPENGPTLRLLPVVSSTLLEAAKRATEGVGD